MSYDPNEKKLFRFDLLRQLRSNYSLIPIVTLLSFGIAIATFSLTRTAMYSPDVSINRRGKF